MPKQCLNNFRGFGKFWEDEPAKEIKSPENGVRTLEIGAWKLKVGAQRSGPGNGGEQFPPDPGAMLPKTGEDVVQI